MNRVLRQLEWAPGRRQKLPPEIPLRRLRPRALPAIVSLMRKGQQSWTTGVLPIAVLIAMLLTLMILQLRWSREISEAERDRLEQSLNRSTALFQSAFSRDLLGLCRSLQTPASGDWKSTKSEIFSRYGAWIRVSGRSALVEGIYFRQQTNAGGILHFDPEHQKLVPTAVPASLKEALGQNGRNLPRRPDQWVWDGEMPGLIHPVYVASNTIGASGSVHPQLYGYLIVLFHTRYFEQLYLPEIARRAFPPAGGFLFQIVHQDREGGRHVIYRSAETVPTGAFARADAEASLLPDGGVTRLKSGASSVVSLSSRPPAWWILVRHHAGSVNAAATELRHRNLGISIAVLLVLAASLLIIVLATLRARRLARLEMEFATGVSHELRTPLAVIRSAAENLADGVVTEQNRVREYGTMIHREGRRLSAMVDHILDFAALHSEARTYNLEPVSAASVIQAAIASSLPVAESAEIAIQTSIPGNLPLLNTDPGALRQCLENLIGNAVKYGKDGRKIEITALRGESGLVHLRVRDYGSGIAPEDRPYIFDPFYRGAGARTSAIRGTGLGLSLTRQIMEALGGKVTVVHPPEGGTAFTLHIPTANR